MYVILWPKGELSFMKEGTYFIFVAEFMRRNMVLFYPFVQWVTCSVSVKWTHTVLFYYYFYYYFIVIITTILDHLHAM